MYVSTALGMVYIKIPKTGGTAIRHLVAGKGFNRTHATRFAPLSDLPRGYWDFRAFAVVRNPYYRLISMYRFDRLTRLSKRTFIDFLKSPRVLSLSQAWFINHPYVECEVIRYEDDPLKRIGEIVGVRRTIQRSVKTQYLGEYSPKEWADPEGIDFITQECAEDFKFGYAPMTWEQL